MNTKINNALSSVNIRFENKISRITDTKNNRINLIENISTYLLSIDCTVDIKPASAILIFYFNGYLTFDAFENIMTICDNIDSMAYNFITFRNNSLEKISYYEITNLGDEFLKKNKITRIDIEYNI